MAQTLNSSSRPPRSSRNIIITVYKMDTRQPCPDPEILPRASTMTFSCAHQNKPEIPSPIPMPAPNQITKEGASLPSQHQSASPEGFYGWIDDPLEPANYTTEYELAGTTSGVHAGTSELCRIPRYVPSLELSEIAEDNILARYRGAIFHRSESMIPVSPDVSRPHTPASSECSQHYMQSAHLPTRSSAETEAVSVNGKSPAALCRGDESVKALVPADRSEPPSLLAYTLSYDSNICYEDDEDNEDDEVDEDDEAQSEKGCADCRAAGTVEMFEDTVLEIAGGDWALAASLIPSLHLLAHQNHKSAVNLRHLSIIQCAGEAGNSASDGHDMFGNQDNSNRSGQKRSADKAVTNRDVEKEWESEGEEENSDPDPKRSKSNTKPKKLRLACPFHKWKPEKYNMAYEADRSGVPKFRTCQGPGFDDYSRLREHLKEKHTFVQCERCPQLFEGPRPKRVNQQDTHRCNPSEDVKLRIEEGIRLKAWSQIEDINKAPKDHKPKTNVEKWNKTWEILFPDVKTPDNPWNDKWDASALHRLSSEENAIENATHDFSVCYEAERQSSENYATSTLHINEQVKDFHRRQSIKAFRSWYRRSRQPLSPVLTSLRVPDTNAAFHIDPTSEGGLLQEHSWEPSFPQSLENISFRPYSNGSVRSHAMPQFHGIDYPHAEMSLRQNSLWNSYQQPQSRTSSLPASLPDTSSSAMYYTPSDSSHHGSSASAAPASLSHLNPQAAANARSHYGNGPNGASYFNQQPREGSPAPSPLDYQPFLYSGSPSGRGGDAEYAFEPMLPDARPEAQTYALYPSQAGYTHDQPHPQGDALPGDPRRDGSGSAAPSNGRHPYGAC